METEKLEPDRSSSQHKGILRTLKPVGGWGAVVGLALSLAAFTYTMGLDVSAARAQQAEDLRQGVERRLEQVEKRAAEAERRLAEVMGGPSPAPPPPTSPPAPPVGTADASQPLPTASRDQALKLVVGRYWDLDKWQSSRSGSDIYLVASDELDDRNDGSFALLGGAPPSYDSCKNATNYSNEFNISLKMGKQFCVWTGEGNVALLRVDALPDQNDEVPTVILQVALWEP